MNLVMGPQAQSGMPLFLFDNKSNIMKTPANYLSTYTILAHAW